MPIKNPKLVILIYASNTCHTKVVDIRAPIDGLSVDSDENTWTFDKKTFTIGEIRHCEYGCRWGVIGVYNRNNLNHLNSMVRHAQIATA